MKIPNKAVRLFQSAVNGNVMSKFFGLWMGRCTFFACLFTACGIALAFLGKLTADYVALVGAIQALLLAHSYKQDVSQVQQQQTTVVNDINIQK